MFRPGPGLVLDDPATMPLVYHPSPRQCPPAVRRGLRAIDPTAELVYLRTGNWLLGSVRPTRIRQRKAIRVLDGLSRHGADTTGMTDAEIDLLRYQRYGTFMVAKLILQGFAPIKLYHTWDPDSSIVEDFRRRDWLYRHRADAEFAERQDEAEGGPEERARFAALQAAIKLFGPELHQRTFRTTKHVHTHGLKRA
jgi:hypothetical protein